jgi:hypothetical protein
MPRTKSSLSLPLSLSMYLSLSLSLSTPPPSHALTHAGGCAGIGAPARVEDVRRQKRWLSCRKEGTIRKKGGYHAHGTLLCRKEGTMRIHASMAHITLKCSHPEPKSRHRRTDSESGGRMMATSCRPTSTTRIFRPTWPSGLTLRSSPRPCARL